MGLLPIKPAEVLFSYTGPDTRPLLRIDRTVTCNLARNRWNRLVFPRNENVAASCHCISYKGIFLPLGMTQIDLLSKELREYENRVLWAQAVAVFCHSGREDYIGCRQNCVAERPGSGRKEADKRTGPLPAPHDQFFGIW